MFLLLWRASQKSGVTVTVAHVSRQIGMEHHTAGGPRCLTRTPAFKRHLIRCPNPCNTHNMRYINNACARIVIKNEIPPVSSRSSITAVEPSQSRISWPNVGFLTYRFGASVKINLPFITVVPCHNLSLQLHLTNYLSKIRTTVRSMYVGNGITCTWNTTIRVPGIHSGCFILTKLYPHICLSAFNYCLFLKPRTAQ